MRIFKDDCGNVPLGIIFISTFIGLILFISLASIGVRVVARHYAAVNCQNFAVNSHRTTKFVRYNWWYWDCLTPSGKDTWIPTDQLRYSK